MKVIKRAKKWTLFKGVSPWILSKNRTFSHRCFSQKLCQKRSFLDILNRKQLFSDQKNWSFNKDQKMDFFKGVSPWILSKNRFFFICFFERNSIRKQRFWYFGKKRMTLSGKNWSFKKGHKKDIFQRGWSMTLSKTHNFSYHFFFTEIISQKIVFRYLWKKRMILRAKKWSIRKCQKIKIF